MVDGCAALSSVEKVLLTIKKFLEAIEMREGSRLTAVRQGSRLTAVRQGSRGE